MNKYFKKNNVQKCKKKIYLFTTYVNILYFNINNI